MTNAYLKLEDKIRQVRRRMRWILFAKGLAVSLGIAIAILILAGFAADHWNYSASALRLARAGSLIAILAVFGWFLVRPLLRPVPDTRLARYVEERHPEIQDRLVSAIELGQKKGEENPLVPLLFADALKRIRPIEPRTLFNPREPLLSGLAASCLVGCFALLQLFGPDFLHYATLKLYADWLYPQGTSIYSIEVVPGDARVRKGSDQLISARLIGFDSPQVSFFSRYQSSARWGKSRMEPEKKSSSFGFLFLDLKEKVHYYVQAGNVRSREFTIEVRDVPQVERVNLLYHYPQYTGLPDRKEEDTGDIAALQGTRVEVEVETNITAQPARLLLAEGTAIPLKQTGHRTLRGTITVTKDSSYKVQLSGPNDPNSFESIEYSITAFEDQAPQVAVTKPGRDTRVTKLEEVLAEAKADDDFGLRSLELHFSVNGGQENVVNLFRGKGEAAKSMSGTHTFFLEEYDLQPGDFVTYFARATDVKNKTDSDIYFLEVRPFGREYSQSQTSGMQGGGQTDTLLSRRQKDILAATFRLVRDRKTFGKREYSENLKVVADEQNKLQREAKTLSERMIRRALTDHDEDFQKLVENLEKAVEAMTPAHRYLSEEKPSQAMRPEQTALQHLMRAESFYREIQVARGNGSGGAGNQSDAQELENLFELELDQLKNQYETLQQQQNRRADTELDEARDRLKELARRQQQLNQRQGQAATSLFSQGGGGSRRAEQMRLQEEVQKLARQLERLSREKQNEELGQASRRLQQAAQDLHNSYQGTNASGENRGTRALNRMNDAQRLIDRFREGSLNDDVRRLQEQASELSRQQEQVRSDLERLTQAIQGLEQGGEAARPAESPRALARRIQSAKNDLKRGLGELQQGLDETARRAAGQQKNAGSRDLRSTANYLRDEGLPRRIDQGRDMIMRGLVDNARQREESIQDSLGELSQRMANAERSLQQGGNSDSPQDRLEEALNRTGDLVSDLESLQRRALEQTSGRRSRDGEQPQQQGRQGQKGQEGQQGQAGQDGRQGGEPGRQAQQGQQGQRGRGQVGGEAGYPGGGRQYAGGPSGGRDAVNFGERAPLDGVVPRLTPEEARQFDKEFQLRLREGQELARRLRDRPDLVAQVDDILKRMKGMPPSRLLADQGELARLKTSVIDGFRQLELQLSRELNEIGRRDNIRLSKDEEIPKEYRKQVEDYYRALAEKRLE
ncbi:MAG: DUF4175 family protein [Acidobacteriota bacterium]